MQTVLSPQQQAAVKSILEILANVPGGPGIQALGGLDFGAQLQAPREGVIVSARVNIATQPTANDTVTVGGHVFKFVAALGAQVAQTQVKLGADAAATRAVLVKALNGTADSVNILEGSTSFSQVALVGGWSLVADAPSGTFVRIRQVKFGYHGQAAYVQTMEPASIAVSASLAAGAPDGWDCGNINEVGHAAGKRFAAGGLTVTAAMRSVGGRSIDLPFTPNPASLRWLCFTSAGVLRGNVNEAVTVSGSTIFITMAGGGAPNFQANDVFAYWISEQ